MQINILELEQVHSGSSHDSRSFARWRVMAVEKALQQ
jgi:hypothetical protein